MALKITEELKAKAEVYYGDEMGQEKTRLLLKEVGLPTGLLPLQDIIECGYVEETGFVWLKQKKKIEHKFEGTGKWVSFATEVQAHAEKQRIKKLVGIKAKELLIWLTVSDVFVHDEKITFKASSGLYRTYPASAFEYEEEVEEAKEDHEVMDKKGAIKA